MKRQALPHKQSDQIDLIQQLKRILKQEKQIDLLKLCLMSVLLSMSTLVVFLSFYPDPLSWFWLIPLLIFYTSLSWGYAHVIKALHKKPYAQLLEEKLISKGLLMKRDQGLIPALVESAPKWSSELLALILLRLNHLKPELKRFRSPLPNELIAMNLVLLLVFGQEVYSQIDFSTPMNVFSSSLVVNSGISLASDQQAHSKLNLIQQKTEAEQELTQSVNKTKPSDLSDRNQASLSDQAQSKRQQLKSKQKSSEPDSRESHLKEQDELNSNEPQEKQKRLLSQIGGQSSQDQRQIADSRLVFTKLLTQKKNNSLLTEPTNSEALKTIQTQIQNLSDQAQSFGAQSHIQAEDYPPSFRPTYSVRP